MFTHDVVPRWIEVLLDVLRELSDTPLAPADVDALLQPEPAPERERAEKTRAAAMALGLITADRDAVRLARPLSAGGARATLLAAVDEHVLCAESAVEPYFAPFYSLVLGMEQEGARAANREEWVTRAKTQLQWEADAANPFNTTKLTGLHRWFEYVGHGWYDTAEVFQANPYERIRRRLPAIFKRARRLTYIEFLNALSEQCPELDGGTVFRKTYPQWDRHTKECSLGLAHALLDLHDDDLLHFEFDRDRPGCSLVACKPPNGCEKFETVALGSGAQP